MEAFASFSFGFLLQVTQKGLMIPVLWKITGVPGEQKLSAPMGLFCWYWHGSELCSSRAAKQTDWTSLKIFILMTGIFSLLVKCHSCRTFLRFLLKSSLKQNFSKMMIEGVGWDEMKGERRNDKRFKQTFYSAVAAFCNRNHWPSFYPLLLCKFKIADTTWSNMFDHHSILPVVE